MYSRCLLGSSSIEALWSFTELMWKLVKVLRHSLCSLGLTATVQEMLSLLLLGLPGGMKGGFLLLFGEAKNDGWGQSRGGSWECYSERAVVVQQWEWACSLWVPLSVSVCKTLGARGSIPSTLPFLLAFHGVCSVAPKQMCPQHLLKDHLLFWHNLEISPIDSLNVGECLMSEWVE